MGAAIAAGVAVHLATERYRERPFDARAPAPDAAPLGRSAYADRLRAEAAAAWSPEALAAAAEATVEVVETRLERVADRLEPPSDWRTAFERLRLEGPETTAETVALYRRELDRARRFVAERGLAPVPEAALEVVEVAQRGITDRHPLAIYLDRKLGVVTAGDDRHCAVCVAPLAVHEGYPGHHTAFERAAVPRPAAGGAGRGQPRFYVEGWALYAELVMLEAGYYGGDPERELAAWRMVLLRAVRAAVDPALHAGELTAEAARARYRDRLLLDAGAAEVEVRGHLERPTAKASYLGGALQILALRRALERRAEAEGAGPLDLGAFHDRLLARPAPWPEVARREFDVGLPPVAAADLPPLLP